MMKIYKKDLSEIQNSIDEAINVYKSWIRCGKVIYIPCRIECADIIFKMVYSIFEENFFILLDTENLKSITQLYDTKTIVLTSISECSLEESLMNELKKPVDNKIELTASDFGFLVFINIHNHSKNIEILPPNIFKDSLPKGFRVFNHYTYENKTMFVLADNFNLSSKKVRIYAGLNDYGSSVMNLPVIKHLLDGYCDNGYKIEIMYQPNSKCYQIYPYLLNDYQHFLYENNTNKISLRKALTQDRNDINFISTCINFVYINQTYISQFKCCHVVREILDMAGIDNSEDKYGKILKSFKININTISKPLKSDLQYIKIKNKYIIGIQLFTSTDLQYIYKSEIPFKSWKKSYAQKFVDMCNHDDIAVVNLTPLLYPLHNVFDVSYLSIGELFGVVDMMDFIVGIDSVSNHIAAILHKRNITIWRRYQPLSLPSPNGGRELSFRPVCMNYSIVDKNPRQCNIIPEIVFDKMTRILKNDITVGDGFIDYKQTSQGYNISYV